MILKLQPELQDNFLRPPLNIPICLNMQIRFLDPHMRLNQTRGLSLPSIASNPIRFRFFPFMSAFHRHRRMPLVQQVSYPIVLP
jgi:hypothetical protein